MITHICPILYFRYGLECVDSCSAKESERYFLSYQVEIFLAQNESYFWCWTNAQNDVSDYWEKCGTSKGDQSYTVRGVPCQSICERKTEEYWWCRDNDQDSSSWDYCSPPGQVLALTHKFQS